MSPERMSASFTDRLFRFSTSVIAAHERADQTTPGNAMNKLLLLAAVVLPIAACADMTPTPATCIDRHRRRGRPARRAPLRSVPAGQDRAFQQGCAAGQQGRRAVAADGG